MRRSSRTPMQAGKLKLVQMLRRALQLDDGTYRAMLKENYGVSSSTELSGEQLSAFAYRLREQAIQAGVWQGARVEKWGRNKHADMGGRVGPNGELMATPAQMRMIEALWAETSRMADAAGREKALRSFLNGRFGVHSLHWLERRQVGKVVATIRAMKARKEGQPIVDEIEEEVRRAKNR